MKIITHYKLGKCGIDWLCVSLNRLDIDSEFIRVVWAGGIQQMRKTHFSPADQLIAHGLNPDNYPEIIDQSTR